jgi:hypothetical protein
VTYPDAPHPTLGTVHTMAAHPYSNLSPADAAVAARSFGRRFRDAAAAAATSLDDEPDEAELDEMANRLGDDGRSALDHVALAVERLESAADSVRAALVNTSHRIDSRLLATVPEAPPTHSGSLDAELGRVEAAGPRLAAVIDDADAGQWLGSRSIDEGGSATPLEVVQAAVAFVLERLKDTERTLRAVRGRPT